VTAGSTTLTDNVSSINFGSATQEHDGGRRGTFNGAQRRGRRVCLLGRCRCRGPAGFLLIDHWWGLSRPGGRASRSRCRWTTSVGGAKSGVVSFANSDADENPFKFFGSGAGRGPPPAAADSGHHGAAGRDGRFRTVRRRRIDFGSVNQGRLRRSRETFYRDQTIGNGGRLNNRVRSSVPAGIHDHRPRCRGRSHRGRAKSFTVRAGHGRSRGAKGRGTVVITTNDPERGSVQTFVIAGTVNPPTPAGGAGHRS